MKTVYGITVLNFDGVPDSAGDVFQGSGVSLVGTPLRGMSHIKEMPIYYQGSSANFMGFAQVWFAGGTQKLGATLRIETFWEKLLDGLTPSVEGRIIARAGNVVLSCEINSIALNSAPNSDRRILTVGEQVAANISALRAGTIPSFYGNPGGPTLPPWRDPTATPVVLDDICNGFNGGTPIHGGVSNGTVGTGLSCRY